MKGLALVGVARFMARRRLPALIVFDLDACLWLPEMYELSTAPTTYSATKGGVAAGGDVVRLFPGAQAVLKQLLTDSSFASVRVAVASSTTEPAYANRCLEALPVDASGQREERLSDLVEFRQIYPGCKGKQHFPALHKQSGIEYAQMLFFDDCTYSDNAGEVAACCPGVTCVRTPQGLTEALFRAGLEAYANSKGQGGVV